MQTIAINSCYGGFNLSDEARELYADLAGKPFDAWDVERDDIHLCNIIQKMGQHANGPCSSLKLVQIPDGIEWQIEEYDGIEWVAEKHRTWK